MVPGIKKVYGAGRALYKTFSKANYSGRFPCDLRARTSYVARLGRYRFSGLIHGGI